MSLFPLAEQILRITESENRTAVLVTPRRFSLRPAFFVELIDVVDKLLKAKPDDAPSVSAPTVKLDFYHPPSGMRERWLQWRAKFQCQMTRRALQQARQGHSLGSVVQWTAVLSRPRADSPIVIGCCDDRQPLPPWAAAIVLSAQSPFQE